MTELEAPDTHLDTEAAEELTTVPTPRKRRSEPTSTVGRGKAVTRTVAPEVTEWTDGQCSIVLADSMTQYARWADPQVIVSDGAYGVLGFEGDTSDHTGMPEWYEPHIVEWSKRATAQTVLWFWNSEIGWASVHPVLERYGWRYVNANIWDKGLGHIAGNVNTKRIRRFPVVSEVCVQYVFEARIDGLLLKHWLFREWKRTGLPVRKANEACGVADAATRKYLDQGHLWYWMPEDMFEKLVTYANTHGKPAGRPYFSRDGQTPMTTAEWRTTRTPFSCPHGVTNVWQRSPLRDSERVKANGSSGKAVHLNQKPLDLITMTLEASSLRSSVVWEPFGGLFTGCVAARRLGLRSYSAETDPTYFHYGLQRLIQEARQDRLL
jgi:DNA methylase